MMRKNCGKHVYEVPAPFCLNKLYRTKCPTNCDKQNRGAKPVCGSDGNTYRSECQLRQYSCRIQKEVAITVYGPCRG